jgi:hypothetical protein
MKKCFMIFVLAGACTMVRGQQVGVSGSKRAIAEATTSKPRTLEFPNSPAANIPLSGHFANYDTSLVFDEHFDRNEVQRNTDLYFSKVFNSRSVEVNKKRNRFKGEGVYLFCADKRGGAASMYQVSYELEVAVLSGKVEVNLNNFKIKNQNLEVSFQYLLTRAMDNDQNAIRILSFFHNNNLKEMNNVLKYTVPTANGMVSK